MSTEEEASKPAAPADAAATTTTTAEPEKNGDADGKKNGQQQRRDDRRKEETPIEDLFDLSQPIPRVEKPNRSEHDKQLQELTDQIDKIKEDRQKIQKQIDDALNDPDSRAKLQEERTKMNALKSQKQALIEEKKAMRAQMDSVRDKADRIIKDKKDARSNVKFNSIDEVQAEINKLQRKQETTTMTLNEEKKLLKEIDGLEASKRFVVDLKSKDAAMDDVREQRKNISAQIGAKDKEIDAFTRQIDEIMNVVKDINDKESVKRDAIQGLFKERDGYKKQIAEIIKSKDAIRSEFREKNNAWYNCQRAVRAQKQIQWEEEKQAREEEEAAWKAKLEEEEAKKIPYEEEQALCEFLANYLERSHLTGKSEDTKDGKKSDVVEVKDDPFAGMTPSKKKADDDEYFGKGKGKKKRVRATKKQDAKAGPFTLSVDTFDQFGLLNLNPPTSIEQVEASVKELREKKEWYKNQPRGSVPTAQEIRKANEKEVAKLRSKQNKGDNSATAGGKKNDKKKFSLSNEDFVPLGAGASAVSNNASWGTQKASAAASAEDAGAVTEEES